MIHHGIERATDMARFWISCGQLALDAQSVVAMRLMGMGGTWAVPRTENGEMLREKVPAFTEAYVAGMMTAASGRGPDRVMQAMIAPLSEKARSNRSRLASAGLRMIGGTSPTKEQAGDENAS